MREGMFLAIWISNKKENIKGVDTYSTDGSVHSFPFFRETLKCFEIPVQTCIFVILKDSNHFPRF